MVDALLYPILISAIGIPVSFFTLIMIRVNSEDQVGPALKKMLIISSSLMAVVMVFVTKIMLPDTFEIGGQTYTDLGVYFCFLTGLLRDLPWD